MHDHYYWLWTEGVVILIVWKACYWLRLEDAWQVTFRSPCISHYWSRDNDCRQLSYHISSCARAICSVCPIEIRKTHGTHWRRCHMLTASPACLNRTACLPTVSILASLSSELLTLPNPVSKKPECSRVFTVTTLEHVCISLWLWCVIGWKLKKFV